MGVGDDPANLSGAIVNKLKSTPRAPAGPSGGPSYGVKFTQVLEIAALISKNFNHDYVGIEHILLAMLKHDNSPISKYFETLNIPEDLIIEEIKNYFQLSPPYPESRTFNGEMIPPGMSNPHFPFFPLSKQVHAFDNIFFLSFT